MLETSRLRLYSLPAKKCAACSATEGRREETEGKRKRVLYTYIHLYVRTCGVYIAIVPCFHSFAERSKELCRRGIKSLNDATMKEGSIGTRNCTVNTEKNIVTERRSNGGWREGCRQGWKELKRKGKDSENGKGKKGESRRSSIAGRKPSREGPIKVSASRRILEIRSPIGRRDLIINSSTLVGEKPTVALKSWAAFSGSRPEIIIASYTIKPWTSPETEASVAGREPRKHGRGLHRCQACPSSNSQVRVRRITLNYYEPSKREPRCVYRVSRIGGPVESRRNDVKPAEGARRGLKSRYSRQGMQIIGTKPFVE